MTGLATPPTSGGPLVVQPLRRRHCAECRGGPVALLVVEGGAPRCLDCADLGHVVCLPRGDTALTRRSRAERGGTSPVGGRGGVGGGGLRAACGHAVRRVVDERGDAV